MAIYHASMRMISRSGGNTVRALAYRTGTDLYDEKTGEWFYYSHKNVGHVDILLPEDAPQWAKDLKQELSRNRTSVIQKISNIAERAEKRKDSQVYREFEFALPRELTEEQNIKLAMEFLQDQACQLGMMAIPSFHFEIDEDTGEEKPHCHAMMLTRRLTEDGLSLTKETAWDKTEVLLTWREQLANYINFYLKLWGYDIRVDHRSYKDQGIDILPQPKLARGMKAMEDKIVFKQQGKTSQDQVMDRRAAYEKIRQHNVAKLIKRPETVFDIVTRGCSTFMWGDVEKVLARYVKEEAIYDRLKVQLETSRDLVLLRQESRVSESGEPEDTSIYTTKTMLKNELSLVRLTEKLGKIQRHQVPDQNVQKAIQKTNAAMAARQQELSLDQVKAVHHVTRGDQLSCVVGYAGAGKSTMFKCAKEAWASSGYQVYGLAPTGRAAQNLEEIGISSQTLHKFLKDYEAGRCQYRRKTVLILDEAGLVDVRRFNALMGAVDHLGVKLVIAGDGAQAQPIEAGPGFRLVTDRLNPQKLDTIIRQEVGWQREASRLFGTYQTQEALTHYLDKGHVQFVEEEVKPLEDLVAKSQHREVVTLYNLSRRLAGNVWHSMVEDMKKQGISSEAFLQEARHHKDYELFKHWQGIRERAAWVMVSSLDVYRPWMQRLGVDPHSFASQFVPHDLGSEDKALRIRELVRHWKLKDLDVDQVLHACDPRHQTRKQLIEAWVSSQEAHPEQSHLIVTYTNKDTALLNQDARSAMRLKGQLAIEEHIHTIQRESRDDFNQKVVHTEQKAFSRGERIVFTRNDKSLGVKNGTLGTLEEVDRHTLKVKLDGQGPEEGRVVSFASKLYPYFDQGWALTIIKSQGSNAHRVFFLATYEHYRNLAYVAMTRHWKSLQVFGSKLDFWRDQIFVDRLSQSREKLSSLDYVSQEEAVGRLTPPARLKEALSSLGNRLESWGYTSGHKWNRLSRFFTGEEVRAEDRLVRLPPTLDEVTRARDLQIHTLAKDPVSPIGTTLPTASRAPVVSGGSQGEGARSSSGSLVLSSDIEAFIDQQARQDALRDGRVSRQESPSVSFPLAFTSAPSMVSSKEEAGSLYKRYRMYQEARPLEGSLAERYLKQHLQIQGPVPSDLRFHPEVWHGPSQQSHPALVALVRNREGHIKAFHQIYLDPITGEKALGELSQDTRGSLRGSYVKIQEGQGSVHVVKEFEQALQLQKQGIEGDLYAALSDLNITELSSFLKDPQVPVVLYGEDHSPVLSQALAALKTQGFLATTQSLETRLKAQAAQNHKVQVAQDHKDQDRTLLETVPSFFKAKALSLKDLQRTTSYLESISSAQIFLIGQEDSITDLSAEGLMAAMTAQKTVFTSGDLARLLLKQVIPDSMDHQLLQHKVAQQWGLPVTPSVSGTSALPALIQAYTQEILKDSAVHPLGLNAKGVALYTSRVCERQEQVLQETLEVLKTRTTSVFDPGLLTQAMKSCEIKEGFSYSLEQQSAITSLYEPSALQMLTGQAGTGKSTVLKPLVQAWQEAGYTVLGTSFQGKVADMLSRELGIEGLTLHRLKGKWQERERIQEQVALGNACPEDARKILSLSQDYHLTDRHVVIVDESNMVPEPLWHALLQEVKISGALLRIVGDNHQIKALEGADVSRLIEQKMGSQKLTDVHRQKVDWQREATGILNQHQITAGLQHYQDQGHLRYQGSAFSARYGLVQAYLEGRQQLPDQSHKILAYRKSDVEDLNEAVRVRLKASGDLGEERLFTSPASGKSLALALGEEVMFTSNDPQGKLVLNLDRSQRPGVNNGTTGKVMAFEDNKIQIQTQDGRLMSVDFKTYDHLSYVYALTINKSEGETYDHTYSLYDQALNANLLLIMASRHRLNATFFIDQSQTPDFKALTQGVNKSEYRGLVADAPHESGNQTSFAKVKSYCDFLEDARLYRDQAIAVGSAAQDSKGEDHPSVTELWEKYHECRSQAHACANEILEAWSSCAPFAHQAGIARDTLEFQAGLQENPLTLAERTALSQVDAWHAYDLKIRQLRQDSAREQDEDRRSVLQANDIEVRSQRNALAYEMIALPTLYQPLLRVREHKGQWISMSGKTYPAKPSGFKKLQSQARTHFAGYVLERYEGVPDLTGRLALGEKLLFQIDALEGTDSLKNRLRFEQQWVKAHPHSSLEALKQAGHHYEAVSGTSQKSLSPEGVMSVCRTLLGEPQLQTPTQLRYGDLHQVSIALEPNKAGYWYNFESGEKGRLPALLQQTQKLSSEETIFAMVQALMNTSQETQASLFMDSFDQQTHDATRAEERLKKQQQIQERTQHLIPLEGSLADRYLTEHRHVRTARSEDILYHAPREGRQVAAMVVLGRNQAGEVTCLQETYLDQRTAHKANFKIKKRSQGIMRGSYGCVQKGPGPYILAEGAETALSLKEAGLQGDIYITFGISNFAHFGSFAQDTRRPVIIAADNDGENAQTQAQLQRAVVKLTQQGFQVFVTAPQEHQADYNDLLQKGGVEAVRACFEKIALQIEGFGIDQAAGGEEPELEDQKITSKKILKQKDVPQEILPQAQEDSPLSYREGKPYYRVEEVNDHLTPYSIELICGRLKGGDYKIGRGGTELRYGDKGAFCISLKTGLWSDYESGEKGNIYQLAQRERHLDFKEALTFVGEGANAPLHRNRYEQKSQEREEGQKALSQNSSPENTQNSSGPKGDEIVNDVQKVASETTQKPQHQEKTQVNSQAVGSETVEVEQIQKAWKKDSWKQEDLIDSLFASPLDRLNPLPIKDREFFETNIQEALSQISSAEQQGRVQSRIRFYQSFQTYKETDVHDPIFLKHLCQSILLEEKIKGQMMIAETESLSGQSLLQKTEKVERISALMGTLALEQFYTQGKEVKEEDEKTLLKEAHMAYERSVAQEQRFGKSFTKLEYMTSPDMALEMAKQATIMQETIGDTPSGEDLTCMMTFYQRQHQMYDQYQLTTPVVEGGRAYWQSYTLQKIIEHYFGRRDVPLEKETLLASIDKIEQEAWSQVFKASALEQALRSPQIAQVDVTETTLKEAQSAFKSEKAKGSQEASAHRQGEFADEQVKTSSRQKENLQSQESLHEKDLKPSYREGKPYYRVEEVDDHLTPYSIELICGRLKGRDYKIRRGGTELRYGDKGEFSISLKTGLWFDYESGEKGNIYQLAQRERHLDFKEALTFVGEGVNAPLHRNRYEQKSQEREESRKTTLSQDSSPESTQDPSRLKGEEMAPSS